MSEKSYSARIKDSIYSMYVKNPCCRKNLYRGIALTMKENPDPRRARAAQFRDELGRELSGKGGELVGEPDDLNYLKCAGCRGMLLRGMFLTAGCVSDPACKNYNLDFTFSDKKLFENGKKILAFCGMSYGERRRRESYVLYIKPCDSISDFFAAAGVNEVVYDIANTRMLSDVAEVQIRTTNAEISNMAKSADASRRACDAVQYLIDSGHISGLDEKLYKTAMIRFKNPELSISQISGLMDEPVSKSTVTARLNRIIK
ncbi:MAG: DNA-binding protein WhiA, partial [Firmicutes bacterium]|nr:DNA-binding protein WhiA [Bacillota bacterium]